MNKQPTFWGKQPNTHSTVKRPTMLTLVSNSRNFAPLRRLFDLATASTQLSSVFASRIPWIRVWKRRNATEALGDQCRFTKGHHKDKQGDYNDEFRSTRQHTTTQHQSTSCYGSRRLSALQIVDTSHSNSPPLETGVFKVEYTTKIRPPTRLDTNLDQRSTEGEQAGSQRILWKGGPRATKSFEFIFTMRGSSDVSISSTKRRFNLRTLFS